MKKQDPTVGTQILCGPEHICYLSSRVPAIRARFEDGAWLVNEISQKAGLLVFIHNGDISNIRCATITEVRNNVAFAVAS